MGGVLLYFVSLQVDLPTVWHGLGRWEQCGIEQITFPNILLFALPIFVIFSLGVFWDLPLGPILGVPHCSAGALHRPKLRSSSKLPSLVP